MSLTTLSDDVLAPIVADLAAENRAFMEVYPGESDRRQAVHTVYGGAHLFKAESPGKLGEVALRSLKEFAPDGAALNAILEAGWEPAFAGKLYGRILEKLTREPVEDFRLDFEDGYGNRVDQEEDAHAVQGAKEVAAGTLPPFIGIRIKPFNEDLRERAVRTLDIFVTTLMKETGGVVPPGFVVTLPKVQLSSQVTAAVRILASLEHELGLPDGCMRIELMIEPPPSPSLTGMASVHCLRWCLRRRGAAAVCTLEFTTIRHRAGSPRPIRRWGTRPVISPAPTW
jgi:hypothetical protein